MPGAGTLDTYPRLVVSWTLEENYNNTSWQANVDINNITMPQP